MSEQIFNIIIAIILIFLNGFFVTAEFALVRARAVRIRSMAESGIKDAKLVLDMMGRLDSYLASNQVGITVASIGLGWVGEPAFAGIIESLIGQPVWLDKGVSHAISAVMAFIIVTMGVLILGEQVPKIIAIRRAEKLVFTTAKIQQLFYVIFYIPLWIINSSTNLILKLLRIPPASEIEVAHTEEELKQIIATSHETGTFTLSRLLMMENILDFGELLVKDVMIPWEKVICLSENIPWTDNQERIIKACHSRYPVLTGAEVTGFIHVKDIAKNAAGIHDISKIKRPINYVNDSLPCEQLLHQFLSKHCHMFFVKNSSQKISGIVTLEDVLEELVGPIRDEFEQQRELSLINLCPQEAIVLDIDETSKENAINHLVQKLATIDKGINAKTIFEGIMKRERLASTGIGDGIAISHCRVDTLKRPLCSIGKSKTGIEYNAIDGKPVKLIFLVLSTAHDEGYHIMILEKISTLLASDYLRGRLEESTSVEEVVEILKASDSSVTA